MKTADLRSMSTEQLADAVVNVKRELTSFVQVESSARGSGKKLKRRELARVLTVLSNKHAGR